MLLRQMTGNVLPKLPRTVTGVFTRFVQRVDFEQAEIQVSQYGRHFSATGGRIFVTLLFTTTEYS